MRQQSDPFVEFANMMKKTGYNKDVILSFAEVIDLAPLTVQIEGNGLETSNLTLMNHLQPQYYDMEIIFDNSTLGTETGKIIIDNKLEIGDRVAVIYDKEGNKIKGFIIDKEG